MAIIASTTAIVLSTFILATVLGTYAVSRIKDWKVVRDANRGIRTIIWGAGGLGLQMLAHVMTDPIQRNKRHVLGFIDDDVHKVGSRVKFSVPMGNNATLTVKPLRIWCTSEAFYDLAERLKVDEIILAFQNPQEDKINSMKLFCLQHKIIFTDASKKRCTLPPPKTV